MTENVSLPNGWINFSDEDLSDLWKKMVREQNDEAYPIVRELLRRDLADRERQVNHPFLWMADVSVWRWAILLGCVVSVGGLIWYLIGASP